MQIGLLIGSDYMWNFFDAKSVRGEELGQGGPVAVSTKVGRVLLGPVENLPREKLSSFQSSSTHVLRTEERKGIWIDCGIWILSAFELRILFLKPFGPSALEVASWAVAR